MTQRLNDLVSDADKLQKDIDAQELADQRAVASRSEDADQADALAFRRRMAESEGVFGKRHPWFVAFACVGMVLVVGARIYFRATAPNPAGSSHVEVGTVLYSAYVPHGRITGAGSPGAAVRLPNGNIVLIGIASGTPLPKGTPVAVRIYDSGAIEPEHPL